MKSGRKSNKPPAARIRLTRAAERDLEAIARYTIRQHGVRQASLYRDGLKAAFATLVSHPEIGVPAEEVLPGLRSMLHGAHRVYYRSSDRGILIVRILHQSMVPPGNLQTSRA